MSTRVPRSKRFPKLYSTAFKACEDLLRYTSTITSNSKNFDPIYSALIFEINQATIKMTTLTIRAIKSPKENKTPLIKLAISHSESLDELIGVAYSIFHLRGKKVDYWASLNQSARNNLEEYLKKI